MAKVLVVDTGTQGLAIEVALKRAGHEVYLMYGDKFNYAAMSRHIDKKIHYSFSSVTEDYIGNLLEVIKQEKIDVIIPMSDASACVIAKNKERLQQAVNFKIPDYDDFMRGYDKNRLMTLCREKGYPHPQSHDLSRIDINDKVVADFHYPALLKPNITTGGRGMVKVESYNDLREKYPSLHEEYGDYHLQQFVESGGRQVKVQLFIDDDKTLRAATMIEKKRWYPVSGGSNCCAVSVYDQATVSLCHNVLKDLNWIGFADFDLIENPQTKELLIMEINPRVPACIKSPIVAGVNWAQVIVEGYLDLPATKFGYKEGTVLRHLGLDALWFTHSPDRFHTDPNWFNFFGKNVYYQDISGWSDPMPFLCGTWRNLKQVLTGHGKKKV